MIRTIVLSLLGWLLFSPWASAQLTLEYCREKARSNYPLLRQYNLLDLSEHYVLENIMKDNLPQVSFSGKASYQSSVTTLPVSLPGISIKGLPKEQFNVVAEIRQKVWDGGNVRSRKKVVQAATEESRRQTDAALYQLNERVDQLYFSILLQDEQLKQNTLMQEELKRNLNQVASYIKNGIANEADLDAVNMELLTTRQQRISLEANRKAYARMLALLMGEAPDASVVLVKPGVPSISSTVNRPELKWYEAQLGQLNMQEAALKTACMPTVSLFAQGGVGNPGLDMLRNGWEPYYIVGVRLSWNLSSLYTLKNDRLKLETERQAVGTNRDVFLLNTKIQLTEQEEAARALDEQLKEDDEIIRLRMNVRKAAEAKVAGGTLSVMEMLRELTNENLARQNKATHEIQLLLRMYRQQYLNN